VKSCGLLIAKLLFSGFSCVDITLGFVRHELSLQHIPAMAVYESIDKNHRLTPLNVATLECVRILWKPFSAVTGK
jgi:hypothetical protein